MIEEELVHRARPSLLHAEQLLEHVEHAVRVVAGGGHELQTEVVRLFFVRPAESRHRAAGDDVGQDGLDRSRVLPEEDRADRTDGLLLFHLLDHVTRHDVADLVRQHAGQHVCVVGLGDQPRVDVDVPAGDGESVHARVVDDMERERPVRQRRGGVDPFADACDVSLGGGVVNQLDLALHLRRHLVAELPLFVE